jgi:hypothetical protein
MELYSFEGVVKVLDSAPLVEALHELEGFAKSQNHEELARWASAEINGYSKRDIRVPEELPSYRKSFQITLTEGIRDIEDDIIKLQSICPLHIPNSNINQLKTRLVQKMAPSLSCDPSKRLDISKRLENLLQDIRSNAKRRVDALRLIDDINLHLRQAERDFDTRVTFVQQELQQEREESMNRPSELKFEKEIFISYAWGKEGEEREDFVNHLDKTLQTKGIKIVRDKRDLPYKGLIKSFMERIGRGKCVIAVISDKYLKSPNCMFELVQVAKNGKFHDRIFPIILADAQIYDPLQRLKYIKHWENKKKELNEAIKEVDAEFLQGIREEIDQYTDIRNMIAEITNLLKDMNTLTPDIHSQSEFQVLIESIECRLNEDRVLTINGSSSPTTQSLDETILWILYDYYLTHKGNPK